MRVNRNTRKTTQTLEKLYDKRLSKKQIFNATTNLVGFFELLIQIDKQKSKTHYEQNN